MFNVACSIDSMSSKILIEEVKDLVLYLFILVRDTASDKMCVCKLLNSYCVFVRNGICIYILLIRVARDCLCCMLQIMGRPNYIPIFYTCN